MPTGHSIPLMTMSLGLNLPYVEGSMDGATPRWADILAMATAGEAVGFDTLWVSDHLGFGDPEGAWSGAWESMTLLSALAVAVPRVRLGTYVTAMPLRNPALLAKMSETLDEVSGGRFILGLGAGWNEPEFTAFGVPFEHRFDAFEEGLRIIAAMFHDGHAELDGTWWTARHAPIAPRGPRPAGPTIMIGTGGTRMLRLTAELADEWNAGMHLPDELPELIAKVDAACEGVGRDPATLPRSAEALIRTIDAADGRAAEEREIRGSPAELAATLQRYADLGMSHVQVQLRPNRLEAVEAFAPVVEALAAS